METELMSKGIVIYKEKLSDDVKVVVPLSGGKDSQACLKLALHKYSPNEILALFCDTGYEHPITYKHVDNLVESLGVCHVYLQAGTVLSVCLKNKRFPGGGARHCTDALKIRPTKFFLKEFSLLHPNLEVWYGMRSGESNERAKRYENKIDDDLYFPHEIMPSSYPKYLAKQGVKFRLPILSWSEEQVFDFLDGEENELYSHGFDRVGCFPCLAGGEKLQKKAFDFDDTGKKHLNVAIEIAKVAGRNVFRTKGMQKHNPPCSICAI